MRSATKVVIFIPFQWVTFESYFRFFLAEQHARSNMVKFILFFWCAVRNDLNVTDSRFYIGAGLTRRGF